MMSRSYFTLLMARANQAYRPRATLRRCSVCSTITSKSNAAGVGEGGAGEDAAAELLRITRQILEHAERDIATLDAERHMLLSGELAQLPYRCVEAAAREHRDRASPNSRAACASRLPMRGAKLRAGSIGRSARMDEKRRWKRANRSGDCSGHPYWQLRRHRTPRAPASPARWPPRRSPMRPPTRTHRQVVADYNARNCTEAAAGFSTSPPSRAMRSRSIS